jgi:hypothetical protein
MFTPRLLVNCFRRVAVACGIGLCVLLLGPFQGLEREFGLTDKEAHVSAFFCLTAALFAVAPKWRRLDLGLMALAFGLTIELLQGMVGRSMSVSDFVADALGVGAALAPGVIEQLRYQRRRYPDVDFATLRLLDRRRAKRHRSVMPSAPSQAPTRRPKSPA